MTGPQIHAPEAIQPHGVLLAFRTDDGTLERCSANAAAVLGASREALAGRTIGEVLGPDIARQIGAAAPTQWGATLIPRRFVDPAGGRHSVQFFAGGHHLVVEIEPQPDEEEDAFELLARTQTGLEALRAVADPRRLAQGLAELASEILGFDRIVVFRFDKDWNRDVIAEVRSETMPGSFLGLRVPAAALPPTARLLYLRAGVRPIVDVDAAATPIIAASGGMPATTPLDLSDSTLRSPPIEHVSHLRSVGVRASLTVAIETGGRLWGILTAHNRQPRLLSAARRATVRLLATSIAALLAAREEASRDHATTERTLQISRAASDILARDLEAAPALQAFAAALVTTTGAGGAVIRVAGIEVGAGSMPDRATVERILQVARGRMEAGRAAIESLAEADPALAPHGASASGLVAMALPGGDGDILALLHGEISEEIVWATAPGDRPTDAGLPWVPAIFRRDSGPVGADEPRVERTRGVARGWPDEVGPLLDVAREAVFDICRVTGERAAHAALRARETELRAIYESVDEGLAHVDALGRVVAANRRFAALVGIDPEDVAGRRFDTLVEITEPSTGGAVLAVGRAKGKPRAEAARDRPIEIRVTAVGDGDGARAVVIRDIAQREQFERELVAAREAAERASRAKDEFLANMSHELRTPLTAVLGYIDLLDQQLRDPVQRKWIATIRRSGWSLLRLLSDLVDFARMDADDIRLEYAVFDPVGKANSLLDLYRPTMDEKGIRGEVRVAAGVPRAVVGDPARARQILGNLVGNAVKFTREGTITIDIDARPTDREGQMELEFAIADTGIGIAPEKLPELFERFSQIDAGITRQFGGVGLGLAIARGLARRMGGDIVAESQGVGRGAVFRLRLPVRTAARATGPAAVAAPAVPGQRGAILIIEDDPVNQELLAEMTRILGFAPEVAGNGEIGVERAAARGDLAAILVDVSLPGMDGKEATRRIRRLSGPSARLPIVCVTALASDRDRSEALEAGADAYLTKPVRLAELRSVLEQATGGKVATGA